MADLRDKKHIFFDLDDTLWDFERNSAAVLEQLFEEYSLGKKLNTDFQSFHSVYKRVNLGLWSKYYKREIDKKHLRNSRFLESFREFNYRDEGENLVITEHYMNRAPHGRHLKEGCHETLLYLQEKNYKLHIITNGFAEIQDIKIDGCGLREYFSHIIVSENHQLTKPDERIFRLAEELAGTSRTDCVMIGDNMESDIQGALNAGWEAIYLSHQNEEGYKGRTIRRLEELRLMF